MKTQQIHPFIWEASDVDLRAGVSDREFDEILGHVHDAGAVLFRGQDIDDDQQIALARRFGLLSGHNAEDREGFLHGTQGGPRLQRLTNTEGVGRMSELCWHSDNQHNEFPIRYLMLYGVGLTTQGKPLAGGETLFASAAQALHRMPDDLLEALSASTCLLSAPGRGSFTRPCIGRHWATGAPYLLLSELTESVVGVEPARSAELLRRAAEVMYDPRVIYRHVWREGDLIVWDNHLLQHARAFFDNAQTRVLRRTAVADDREPTALAV